MAKMRDTSRAKGLVLTRSIGDGIVIVAGGKIIEITYVSRASSQIRLAIKAPADVVINRLEILKTGDN